MGLDRVYPALQAWEAAKLTDEDELAQQAADAAALGPCGRTAAACASVTFTDAILRHAGEATFVTNNFRALSANQQNQIITFLKSL
jgi:hypothetical protein